MRISDGILTIKDKVEFLLSKFQQLRDNDTLLWLAYLNCHHGLRNKIGMDAYNVLKEILLNEDTPKFESVRRVRQKIQETGMFQGKKRLNRIYEQDFVKSALNKI